MTTLEKLGELIIKFKKGRVAPEALSPEASLANDLGLDSLDMMELIVLAEDACQVQIDLEEAKSLKTLGETAQYIDKLIAG